MLPSRLLAETLEPSGGEGHQLGYARQVPVCVRDLCVPEVGRKGGDALLDVYTLSVPSEETLAREGVPQVVNVGTAVKPDRMRDEIDELAAHTAHS
jgi:hypothetical protein